MAPSLPHIDHRMPPSAGLDYASGGGQTSGKGELLVLEDNKECAKALPRQFTHSSQWALAPTFTPCATLELSRLGSWTSAVHAEAARNNQVDTISVRSAAITLGKRAVVCVKVAAWTPQPGVPTAQCRDACDGLGLSEASLLYDTAASHASRHAQLPAPSSGSSVWTGCMPRA